MSHLLTGLLASACLAVGIAADATPLPVVVHGTCHVRPAYPPLVMLTPSGPVVVPPPMLWLPCDDTMLGFAQRET